MNKKEIKKSIVSLNSQVFEQTYFKYDLRNPFNKFQAFLNDETRKSWLELKDKTKENKELFAIVKKELTRDILYVGAECEKFSEIGIEEEFTEMKNIFDNDFINLVRVKPPSIDNIIESWDKIRAEIILFSCHGDNFGLYIQNGEMKCTHISNLDLISFFEKRSNYTECVVLSACESLTLAKKIADVGKNVVAINKKININTARKFGSYFLKYLNNHSLDYNHVYKEAFNYSEEIVKYEGLEDSFAFEFISANKIT